VSEEKTKQVSESTESEDGLAEAVGDVVGEVSEKVTESVSDVTEKVTETVSDVSGEVGEKVTEVLEHEYVERAYTWGEQILSWFLPNLSTVEWTGHIAILLWSVAMFLFAGKLFSMVENTSSTMFKMKVFRFLNFVAITLLLADLVLLRFQQDYKQLFSSIGLTLFTSYSIIYLYALASYNIFKRFGSPKMIDNKEVYVETYSTRIVNLLLVITATFSAFYIIIKIWGADSLLETTGLMGIFVGFLAFTAPVWAPDIISGLIILNSQILDDGDIVVIDGFPNEYIISKVSFVYVTLYDIRNNHRALVKNSRFLAGKIDNLCRIASTEGMRSSITYNIGYPEFTGSNGKQRVEALDKFIADIDSMFYRAFESCRDDENVHINDNRRFEWALSKTGDYALEFTLWFYYKRIPNTKITATARKFLMGTLFRVNQAVYRASIFEGIDLSTPDLSNITFTGSARNSEEDEEPEQSNRIAQNKKENKQDKSDNQA